MTVGRHRPGHLQQKPRRGADWPAVAHSRRADASVLKETKRGQLRQELREVKDFLDRLQHLQFGRSSEKRTTDTRDVAGSNVHPRRRQTFPLSRKSSSWKNPTRCVRSVMAQPHRSCPWPAETARHPALHTGVCPGVRHQQVPGPFAAGAAAPPDGPSGAEGLIPDALRSARPTRRPRRGYLRRHRSVDSGRRCDGDGRDALASPARARNQRSFSGLEIHPWCRVKLRHRRPTIELGENHQLTQ